MKPIPLLIAVSLVGNAALVAVLFFVSPEGAASDSGDSAATAKSTHPTAPAKVDVTAGVDPKLWHDLGDPDLSAQIARLRAAGFPPSIVRAIIAAQIEESFTAKRKALSPPPSTGEFWKGGQPADPKLRAALRELSLQQTRLLTELLGADPEVNPMQNIYERRQLAGLPPGKTDQLARVKRDYDEMRSEIYSAFSGGTLLPEDRAKIALLDKEQRADFAGILSPEEMENYELRSSSTANQMRYSLSAFNPTEAEFRAIYQQQRVFDEKYSGMSMVSATQETMQARAEAQKLLAAQIKTALGPERGADYERATDYNFQAINRVVERLALPKAAATEVWTLQKDVEQRTRALQTNRELTPDARAAQFAALNTEVTAKLTTTLGQRGFDVYKQNGGYWLQTLQPRPATPPGAPGGGGGTTTTTIITRPGG